MIPAAPGGEPGVRRMVASTMGGYRYLWTPLELGPVTVRNRIVFSAHLTNYARDGQPTEQHAAYYAARAAGGTGLIITEEHSTHPTDWPYEKLIHGFHRDVIPGYLRITEAVHRHRVPVFAQINHNGGQASSMYTRLPVWAPSPVADPLFREVPKAVTAAEIDEIVAGYATRRRALRRGRLRRHRAAVQPLVDRPRLPLPGHQPPHRRLRRQPGEPGPPAARDRRRRAAGDRQPARPRRAPVRRRADRRRHDHRRGGRRSPGWSRRPVRSTTSTPRSAWRRRRCS